MKNELESWIENSNNNEHRVMNVLQDYGIVSDNCVMAKDVGNPLKAMRWIAVNSKLLKKF